SVQGQSGVVSNVYDNLGRLTNTVQSGTGILPVDSSFAYDPVGSLTNLTLSIGGVPVLARHYQTDAADRLAQLQAGEAGEWAFAYNPTNGLVEAVAALDAGLGAQYGYDVMDRLTNIVWNGTNSQYGLALAYDSADMIARLSHSTGETRAYTYDSIDRLTGEAHFDAAETLIYSATYEYDLAGNRTRTVINGATNEYTLGLGNRLDTWTDGSYAHNPAGCVTQITAAAGTRTLAWDSAYRLTAVSTDGALAESYGYDPLGRRAWTATGGVTYWHVYAGVHCIADTDATGALLRSYTWGPGIDNLLAITVHGATETNTYFALTDHLGTVHALADDTGAVAEAYRYDAFGNVLGVFDGNGQPLLGSALGNRFLFHGREYSWTTGLYNFRARWYDPATGRWLSKDPIGISGGLNQYVFCGNNPVNCRDPFGLWNLWSPGTWGVPNGVGWSWRDSINPFHESAGWSGAWEGAKGGALAFADGVIPFWDPFEDYYADECGNVDSAYKWSRGIGRATRDIELSLLYMYGGVPASLTHYTTQAGARGIAQDGVIRGGAGLFGKGVYLTKVGRPVNLFVPAGSMVPIQVSTPAWTARIIPKLVYVKWGSGIPVP
ncbi:MAG: hypothetical protein K9N51_10975, partial [Candidatus Pacebacteria bacterium]|nr:hypothetical protein [Candidatus Paceibacterota bacterium]